jgi:predicted nuclease of predicted toxin-antitoxin system
VRFLVDAQLPIGLCGFIRNRGGDATHVSDAGLFEAEDAPIWHYAIAHSFVIVTKDEDFAQRRAMVRSGPSVVWVRVGNCSNKALFDWLGPLWVDVVSRLNAGETLIELV